MLARWAPFDVVDRDFQNLVRRAFGDLGSSLLAGEARAWAPPLDAFTKDGALHVRIEAPGLDPERDVDIEVTDGALRIRGERHREEETSDEGYFRREMSFGRFERAIALPQGVDPSSVSADYDAGILHVTVPLPQKQANKVKVEIGPQTTQKQLEE